jgi:excinuclease ABC subunit C
VKGQDDFASMAEVIRRRYSRILLEAREHVGEDAADATQENPLDAMRRIEREESASADVKAGEKRRPFVRLPDLVIVDGGKGQLSKAVAELNRLGLHELPVIGLAKQHEEIFRPGESEPLLIPHDKGALKLLQRIRDEAHRFANGYHQLLMKRRVQESILDDCPGISRARKERLLEKFKSVSRMRKATPQELASVSGINEKLGEEIAHFLKTHG